MGLPDVLVVAFLAGLVLLIASSNRAVGSVAGFGAIDLRLSFLPFYVFRSVLRMFAAFALSTAFTLVYGYIAARHRIAETLLIPALDILQSVPVLGFLSVTVASLASLFPGSTVGFELASIFAIFTSQAWNMTFAFYESLTAVPRDLMECCEVFGLSKWDRFRKLELPSSMISLVWNGMMSFGGGWFFLAASEAISVLGRDVRLPGIGSYMATAIERQDMGALGASLASMAVVIVLMDQLVWRPVISWSRRYKIELTPTPDVPESFLWDAFAQSFLGRLASKAAIRLSDAVSSGLGRIAAAARLWRGIGKVLTFGAYVFSGVLLAFGLSKAGPAVWVLVQSVDARMISRVFYLGMLTLARVTAAVLLGMLWTVPAGVKIGTDPHLRRILQPVVQMAASFPANMLFPFVTVLYVKRGVNFELGAIPLMMLGTQWYILFNVIGGAMSIPGDLEEAARIYRLRGWAKWRTLILPFSRHGRGHGGRRGMERQHRCGDHFLGRHHSEGYRAWGVHRGLHGAGRLARDSLEHIGDVRNRGRCEQDSLAQAIS